LTAEVLAGDAGEVAQALAVGWGVRGDPVPLDGGMNSACWLVSDSGRRFVLKIVPASAARQFGAGLQAAAMLAAAGVRAGAPMATRRGTLATSVGGGVAALLT
jgi:Ser/Thr protein kinase RdoA (MazF antagonist)